MLTTILLISLLLAFSKKDGRIWRVLNWLRYRLMHSDEGRIRRARRVIRAISASSVLIFFFIIFCNWRVEKLSKHYSYTDPLSLPENHTGVIIGTPKELQNGIPNPYYLDRIIGAAELFNLGKVNHFVITSESRRLHPNELTVLKKDLIRYGIPSDSIFEEYYSLRPYESILKSIELYDYHKLIIISQPFQAKSAVYLARKKGVDAVAYELDDRHGKIWGFKTKLKEYIRRMRLFYDIYFNSKPEKHFEEVDQLV